MKLLISLIFSAVAFGTLMEVPAAAQENWPERPVTIVVPAGAGGGTDSTSRMLAVRLEEMFGQPFNVVNQGQGGGVTGFTSIKNAEPNGYTLGVIYNFAHYKPMGQGEFDAEHFTPVAQFNFDPAGFHVRTDSDWTTLPQALDDIKANPSDYTIACGGGCGGSWPIAAATLFVEWDIDLAQIRMVPGQGAAAALQDLAAGGMDVVPCSVPEAGALIDAGRVKGLAVFGQERLQAFPDIPTLKEAADLDLELGAWRGLVGPAGLPEDIAARLEAALNEIVHSDGWREEMTSRGFGIRWRPSNEFGTFMNSEQVSVRQIVDTLGL